MTRDFQFQQFRVRQVASAMKVCTDATLFGAMAPLVPGERVLDIGAGTGLLSLMLAQRGAGSVRAVEIDADASVEASDNFAQSPWRDCLVLVHGDVRDPHTWGDGTYDLVICNPPFFVDHTPSGDPARRRARHAEDRFLEELLRVVGSVISDTGRFHVLLPSERLDDLVALGEPQGLYPACSTRIHGQANLPGKLSAVTLMREPPPFIKRHLNVYDAPRQYSAAAAAYLGDFLLRFAASHKE